MIQPPSAGLEPVWHAEVLHVSVIGRVKVAIHQRPAEEGGPNFTTLASAKQWCETRLAELIGSGIHPIELEAYILQGRWIDDKDAGEPQLVEDDDSPWHVCRSDANRDTFTWVTGPTGPDIATTSGGESP